MPILHSFCQSSNMEFWIDLTAQASTSVFSGEGEEEISNNMSHTRKGIIDSKQHFEAFGGGALPPEKQFRGENMILPPPPTRFIICLTGMERINIKFIHVLKLESKRETCRTTEGKVKGKYQNQPILGTNQTFVCNQLIIRIPQKLNVLVHIATLFSIRCIESKIAQDGYYSNINYSCPVLTFRSSSIIIL